MIVTLILTLLSAIPMHEACSGHRAEIVTMERRFACSAIALEAEARGFDPRLIVELAWTESRWDPRAHNSDSGCRGILQYDPRFWKDGFEALAYYLDKHDGEAWRAVCDFKTRGTPRCGAEDPECCPRSKGLVRRARL